MERVEAARPERVTNAETRWPLEGVKVVDAGAFLAGPLGPMLLSDLGADVVKVEPPGGEGMRWVEWSFFGCQRGKRGVALDLKARRRGRARRADRRRRHLPPQPAHARGAAPRLDEESVRAVNPDIVYCHTSSYGPVGPRGDWPGYDQLFQASCGWEVAGVGEGNPPMWHRFGFMDHMCAMGSVIADAARALPPRPHRSDALRGRVAAGRGRAHGQRDVPRRRREDGRHAGPRPRANRHLARLPHPAGHRWLDRHRRHHRRRARRVPHGRRCRRRRRRGRRARQHARATTRSPRSRAGGVPCEAVRLDQCESFFAPPTTTPPG